MFRNLCSVSKTTVYCASYRRNFKNFGHKKQPTPPITMWWTGFLTFTFIGMAIEWKRVAKFFLGDAAEEESVPITPSTLYGSRGTDL
ncbi:unnamed protein product [Plutella xylostella]|uniref:(diamondback moth) hypothetical protein n=1 Tax=Plutella xylostella TaxID=51655 RepID=A0A8S4EHS9_PLUXY|nr:unnamed protein product [Plutella xylostella]